MSTAVRTNEAIIVTTSDPIPWETIANMMVSFVESGDPVTRGWCSGFRATEDSLRRWGLHEVVSDQDIWYAERSFWSRSAWQVEVSINDGDEQKKIVLMPKDFVAALVLLADGKYRHHFADIVAQNTDRATADIFMQMAAFGKETYA